MWKSFNNKIRLKSRQIDSDVWQEQRYVIVSDRGKIMPVEGTCRNICGTGTTTPQYQTDEHQSTKKDHVLMTCRECCLISWSIMSHNCSFHLSVSIQWLSSLPNHAHVWWSYNIWYIFKSSCCVMAQFLFVPWKLFYSLCIAQNIFHVSFASCDPPNCVGSLSIWQ